LGQLNGITAKTALSIAKAHAGFDAEPKSRDGIRAPSSSRRARGVKIANTDDQRLWLRFSRSKKFWKILRPMLRVGIHRDRVSETLSGSMFESGAQGSAFAGILFQPSDFAFR
jgi:hypothetical protein